MWPVPYCLRNRIVANAALYNTRVVHLNMHYMNANIYFMSLYAYSMIAI